jgi:aryl sulfotransferase
MQAIVANLIFQDGAFPAPVSVMSPWLDMAIPPLDQVSQTLEAQTHRRFIKSHLALDGLPYFETARYIVVGRDIRDVFMSMWNHHTGYTDHTKAIFRERAAALGSEFPLDLQDIHELWRIWIDRGSFEWESSGFPYWSHLHHTQTWWDFRHVPNILLVHYTDLLEDPEGQVRRIAKHLDIAVDEQQLPGILERISFSGMKGNFMSIMPEAEQFFRGGQATFMNKGTNGRWRGVLTEAELDQCRAAIERELTEDCAGWLEHGGDHRLASSAAAPGD